MVDVSDDGHIAYVFPAGQRTRESTKKGRPGTGRPFSSLDAEPVSRPRRGGYSPPTGVPFVWAGSGLVVEV